MQKVRFNLSALMRRLRFIVAAFVCALVFISYALPAYSATTSRPTEGEANLLDIERKAQEAVLANPSDFDMKKQQEETSNGGLNEIQGTADFDKMKRPDNSQNASSVEEKIKDTLEGIAGKK